MSAHVFAPGREPGRCARCGCAEAEAVHGGAGGMSDIPAEELLPLLEEIWNWAFDMYEGSTGKSTYGIDAVGRCIQLVEMWPDKRWQWANWTKDARDSYEQAHGYPGPYKRRGVTGG